jgi:3-phosphoshikimate 1-carboxyvinyltransferase
MSLQLHPGALDGRATAPPSKSYTHRALILAALSGDGHLERPLHAADTHATLNALAALGYTHEPTSEGIRIHGAPHAREATIDCANSGTTLRLMTALASVQAATTRLDGDASLRRRPMDALLDGLKQLGVAHESHEGHAPLSVRGPWRHYETRLDAQASSQYVTGLMLAALNARHDTRIHITKPPRSRPYIDITRHIMAAYGLRLDALPDAYLVPAGQSPRRRTYRIPGDYSSAAALMVGAAITGGRIEIDGLDPQDPQGDRAILEILERFGARVRRHDQRIQVEGADLVGQHVDLAATPDLFPVLCALAAVARGTTRLDGAPQLRLKESDRIAAMSDNLTRFGIQNTPLEDGIQIQGGRPRAATIQSHGDHRIAQAGLLLGLVAQGESHLPDPQTLDVSYPSFIDTLRHLGGKITL